MTLREIADLYPGGRWHGDTYETHCPCGGHRHDDRNPSLGFSPGRNGGIVACCQKGHDVREILAAKGLTLADLAPPPPERNGTGALVPEAVYRYDDEKGEPLYEKVRLPRGSEPRFYQRRPGAKGGGIGEVRRVLFGLPELLATKPGALIGIAEGEKDVLSLRRAGLPGTTNPEGASLPGQRPKWKPEYTQWLVDHLADRKFLIFADQDEAGLAHAEAVYESLNKAGLAVRVAPLSGLKAGEDISDWLGRHTEAEFQELLKEPRHALSLRVLSGAALQGLALPEPEPLVPHLLYRGLSTLLAGDSKLGKSSLLLRMMLALACGGWWLDRDRREENRLPMSRVLFLNFEDPLYLTRQRALRMMTPEELPDNFLTMEVPYDFSLPEILAWLPEAKREFDLDAVVMDPIAIAAEWEKEEDNARVALTFKSIQRTAAETQLALLSAHHVTKKAGAFGMNIRGASAIKANVMGYLVLEREREGIRLAGINKLAGEWDVLLGRDEHDYSWWIDETRAGNTRTPQQAAKAEAKADLLLVVQAEPGVLFERLQELSGLKERTLRGYLGEMEGQSVLFSHTLPREPGQLGRSPVGYYALPETGE